MLESNAIAACRKAALDDPNVVYGMKEKSLDIMTSDLPLEIQHNSLAVTKISYSGPFAVSELNDVPSPPKKKARKA